jgi:hypothetical protein
LDQVLGLALLAAYIIGVVAFAAGVTWVIVKLFPTERDGDKRDEQKKEPSTNDAVPSGRLFRRAKRGAT